MYNYIEYEHHGEWVRVREDLKGKHQDLCLCGNCELFTPEDRENSCKTANLLYALCVAHDLCSPVTECPCFEPIEGEIIGCEEEDE